MCTFPFYYRILNRNHSPQDHGTKKNNKNDKRTKNLQGNYLDTQLYFFIKQFKDYSFCFSPREIDDF